MKGVGIPSTVPMQPFQIKTIALRQCSTCRTTWSSERETLEPGDQINIVIVKIAYCPVCAEDFAQQEGRPTYQRRTGKRIR